MKSMVSLVNSHTNATRIGWNLWEIDLRFAPGLPPGRNRAWKPWAAHLSMMSAPGCFNETALSGAAPSGAAPCVAEEIAPLVFSSTCGDPRNGRSTLLLLLLLYSRYRSYKVLGP